MKSRRVFVTLEIETTAKLSDYRSAQRWRQALYGCPAIMWGDVLQAQANVTVPHKAVAAVAREKVSVKWTPEGREWLRKFKKAEAEAHKKANYRKVLQRGKWAKKAKRKA